MTQREQIKALQAEVAELRERVAELAGRATVHHHHHYPPPPTAPFLPMHPGLLPLPPTYSNAGGIYP